MVDANVATTLIFDVTTVPSSMLQSTNEYVYCWVLMLGVAVIVATVISSNPLPNLTTNWLLVISITEPYLTFEILEDCFI